MILYISISILLCICIKLYINNNKFFKFYKTDIFYLSNILFFFGYQINHSQIENIKCYKQFPLFKQAKYMKIKLTPGDIIFIPKYWWHWVYSENSKNKTEKNISMSINVNDEKYWDNILKLDESHIDSYYTQISHINQTDINNSIFKDFISQNKPFFIHKYNEIKKSNYYKNWKSNKYLIKNLNTHKFIVGYNKSSTVIPVIKSNKTQNHNYMTDMNIKEYIKRINNQSDKTGYYYLGQNNIIPHLLKKDLQLPSWIEQQKIRNIYFWMNNGNINSGLHYDGRDNLLLQISGTKTIYLFSPEQTEFLYRGIFKNLSFINTTETTNST